MTGPRPMRNAVVLPLALIDPHPANVREQLGDLTDLAESIRRKGVLQPVVVQPHGDRFRLIAGHRRCAAAHLAGRDVVPAVVRVDVTDAQVVEAMLEENTHRRRLNPIEEARAYRALLADGTRTQAQVAAAVGVSHMTVSKRLALLELSDAEQRAIVNKAMSLEDGWELAHQRRWERGERRGQKLEAPRGPKEARPRWVPHFNADHPLADRARAACREAHPGAPRSTRLSDVACGPCWEAVVRASTREQLLAGAVPQLDDGAAVELAGA